MDLSSLISSAAELLWNQAKQSFALLAELSSAELSWLRLDGLGAPTGPPGAEKMKKLGQK